MEPLTVGNRIFDFKRPYIVGILNITPDSFSDGGEHASPEKAASRCLEMVEEGADMIDIGGESTRPSSRSVSAEEELERVLPVIRLIRKKTDIPVSVDTTKASVAEAAVGEGADLVNDISGLRFDPAMARTAARLEVPIVLMHSRKAPSDMQKDVHYDDLFGEVSAELSEAIRAAQDAGVPGSCIIVDPGIGFAKTAQHNVRILGDVGFLASLGKPVMVGPSRKSFIGAYTGAEVHDRLGGTAAAVTAAVLGGAHFLRVHDVKVMKQAAMIAFSMRDCNMEKA
ncbi:MAG: dihydropteroate synthase [Pseudomonadota bacterium]